MDNVELDTLATIFENLNKDIVKRTNIPSISTGIPPLDALIWGVHRRELMAIGARPSEGKSSLAMFMAYQMACQGKTVVFISLEMTREQLLERMFCHVCDIDSWELRKGNIPPNYQELSQSFKKIIDSMPLIIIHGVGREFHEIESLISSLKKNKPDVLFLDYVQLISADKEMSRRDSITSYLPRMRDLAVKHDLAAIVLSQLNRDTHNNKMSRPSIKHFKESGSIEETADTCLLLWWKTMEEEMSMVSDEQDAHDAATNVKSEYHIICAKQRHGPIGEVNINFHPGKFRFTQIPSFNLKKEEQNNA